MMGSSASINKKIVGYLDQLNPDQKKTVLSVAKALAEKSKEADIWEDKSFVEEMEKRATALETGTAKGFQWDDVKNITRQAIMETKPK